MRSPIYASDRRRIVCRPNRVLDHPRGTQGWPKGLQHSPSTWLAVNRPSTPIRIHTGWIHDHVCTNSPRSAIKATETITAVDGFLWPLGVSFLRFSLRPSGRSFLVTHNYAYLGREVRAKSDLDESQICLKIIIMLHCACTGKSRRPTLWYYVLWSRTTSFRAVFFGADLKKLLHMERCFTWS